MRRNKQDPVRYLVDYHNAREQARRERQRAARQAERKTLIAQAIVGIIGFLTLTAASGILG